MDEWNLKITNKKCPFRVYPTHTKTTSWEKGYCKELSTDEKDIECRCENCPRRVI